MCVRSHTTHTRRKYPQIHYRILTCTITGYSISRLDCVTFLNKFGIPSYKISEKVLHRYWIYRIIDLFFIVALNRTKTFFLLSPNFKYISISFWVRVHTSSAKKNRPFVLSQEQTLPTLDLHISHSEVRNIIFFLDIHWQDDVRSKGWARKEEGEATSY